MIAFIRRALCFMAYHKLQTLEEMNHYEICECVRPECRRRWIVQPREHKVWEVGK